MNIFRRKKALLDEIADLNGQIGVQSREMAAFRKANTDLNRLWEETKKERNKLKEELRDKGDVIQNMNLIIRAHQEEQSRLYHKIDELQDTNNGLASSVTELKGKLREKEKRVRELNARIDVLKSKLAKQ